MDRVKLGLEKAYRGWGIPGHLYSRQGEILAAGQEEKFALPRELLADCLRIWKNGTGRRFTASRQVSV